jgi:hypothetical protein
MILFGELQEGGRVEVSVNGDKLDIIYKRAMITEQFKPKTHNAKTSQ